MRELKKKLGKSLTELKKFFCRQPNIAAVYVFGSFGTEYEHSFSDIDLGVVFENSNVSLQDEMGLEASVSLLLNREKIDLVNLKKAPVRLQYRAVSEGELIYEGSYEAHSDFLENVYKHYLDYLPDLEAYEREYEKALKEAYLNHG